MATEDGAGLKPDHAEGALAVDFEQAMQELEALSRRMDDPRLPLNDMLASFERGVTLIAACKAHLARVEQQVSVLEGSMLKAFGEDGLLSGSQAGGRR